MDALKELSAVALDCLKHEFFLHHGNDGLDEEVFIDVITRVCMEHNTSIIPSVVQIRKLFAAVDVFGVGRISWNDFLMHSVDSLHRRLYEEPWGESQDEFLFRPFRIRQVMKNEYGSQVTDMRVLHKTRGVMEVLTENNGLSALHLCDARQDLSYAAAIEKYPYSLLAWDYIPLVKGISFSNSIVCSYNDCHLRFFSLRRKRYDGLLENCHCMRMSETQSVLQWVASSNLLAMGSCTGMISLWDMEKRAEVILKQLFHNTVTAIRTQKEFLYAASLDSCNAVKCFDIERGVVRFSLNDHDPGGALILDLDDHFLYSSGFGRSIVQRSLVVPRASPMHFFDYVHPHKGRITAIQRLQGLPILVSGDTQGTLKFWDIRMGFCVQTIHGSSSSNALSSVNSEDELPELEPGLTGYRAARVNSICHLDMIKMIKVATSRESLMLSADAFIRPELSDDHHNCRFLFFPDPDCIITVHDRCVKLWNSVTGLLTDVSEPNIIKYDVTASCMVQPLNRQLLVGTTGGEVKALSVAILQETINLTPVLHMYLRGAEIVNLHTVAKYRDSTVPHVLVITQHRVLLVSLRPNCGSQSVIHFHGILQSFMQPHQVIGTSSATETRLLLATSDACVHVIQYQGPVTHAHTFSLSADVETIIARTVIVTSTDAHNEELRTTSTPSLGNEIAFFSDVSGRVHIVLMRQISPAHTERESGPSHRRGSKYVLCTCEELGSWCPRKPNSWRTAQGCATAQQYTGECYRRSRTRSTSLDFLLPEEEPNPVSAVTETIDALPLHAVTSSAVLIAYFDRYQALVTVDETGEICIWDVANILARMELHVSTTSNASTTTSTISCFNNPNSSSTLAHTDAELCVGRGPPPLITAWRCQGLEVIRLAAAEHPALGLPLLLTATADRQAVLWSADGISLGVLAAGRTNSGGNTAAMRRMGVQPYRLMCNQSTTAAQWTKFIAYIQKRKKKEQQQLQQEEQEQRQRPQAKKRDSLLSCSRPRVLCHRKASQLQVGGKGMRDECHLSTGTGTLLGNNVIFASKTFESPFKLPHIPSLSMSTARDPFTVRMKDVSNNSAANGRGKVHDDGTTEPRTDYEQRHARGGSSIVKPVHRRLVTRRVAPVSLERTGIVTLPPLFSGKQQQRR